ncbi:MAG TPA: hypothetical protein VIN08_25665 [Ohtaekwangia sp.]|uniref:hypothetical protein n=1 Tax=Ohtaekwangia sp. TaxID=2066019 RepID=UPI002F94A2E3
MRKISIPGIALVLLAGAALITGCARQSDKTNDVNALIMNKKYTSTFKFKPCDKIILTYYDRMSDQRDSIPPHKTSTITDHATINRILALTDKLPDKGDIMIKMGDVSILETTLVYPDSVVYFTYYESRVKTPDTSFYSERPQEEKVLYELLISTLNQ